MPVAGSRIELRAVSRRFGRVAAVDGVSLTIEPGEFLTLLGPSGSGKSTLLAAIAGFSPVDEGDILVDGVSVRQVAPHRRGFGMVFQHYALFAHMTVAQNVAFALRMEGVGRSETDARVRETLALLRLGELAERKPSQLSGGQQQRVAIARAIVRRPRVVLMDEPLSALDRRLRESIQSEIRSLHRQLGTTIVFVTHDQSEALALSDRVAVLNQGQIVQLGTPDQLYRQPQAEFVARFVGESNVLAAQVLGRHNDEVVELRTLGGLSLSAHHGAGPRAAAWVAGQQVQVLLRPERLALVPAQTPGAWAARVESSVFLGELLRLDVVLSSGERLQVRTLDVQGVQRPAPGDEVHLAFGAHDAWVLP